VRPSPCDAKLWEEARKIPGLIRQMFRDVISDSRLGAHLAAITDALKAFETLIESFEGR
jgi:hypothetical protein